MTQKSIYVVAAIIALAAGVRWWFACGSSPLADIQEQPRTPYIEVAPLCPWRDPPQDLGAFFPGADHYKPETRILSGLRVELAQQLGRTPTAEENALQLYWIYCQQQAVGTVLTTRVKGEYGALEIVLAVNPAGEVCGLRYQRLREPELTAAVLQQPEWLKAFRGKNVHSKWQLGDDIPDVPPAARVSAKAVVDGVRNMLILFDTASRPTALTARRHH